MIVLPLAVNMPRKKTADRVWVLNLNSYRNTHFQILNQAKVAWKDIVCDALIGKCIDKLGGGPYRFTYTVFPANNRRFDIGNVLPVVQKFTDDALIELGVISDDSYKHISQNVHLFGGVDKLNPRVELVITLATGI